MKAVMEAPRPSMRKRVLGDGKLVDIAGKWVIVKLI